MGELLKKVGCYEEKYSFYWQPGMETIEQQENTPGLACDKWLHFQYNNRYRVEGANSCENLSYENIFSKIEQAVREATNGAAHLCGKAAAQSKTNCTRLEYKLKYFTWDCEQSTEQDEDGETRNVIDLVITIQIEFRCIEPQ